MRRDLEEAADAKLTARRLFDQLNDDFTDDEIDAILRETVRLRAKKGKQRKGME